MPLTVNITLDESVRMQSVISAQRSRENKGTVACVSIIGIRRSGGMALMFTGVQFMWSPVSASNWFLAEPIRTVVSLIRATSEANSSYSLLHYLWSHLASHYVPLALKRDFSHTKR
jgi:hypothetical protein